ncbi:tetracycline resistance transcriptional repressor TetR [Serratia marcescens]|uniref:tetracycline resistance transcriptional repressor TetR n=1 Tax=Serratia marcescens TaxID=615 RepID=UPI001EFF3111|nr:tetracycline resistance transcriptional repressor TetR [Serratia marcescens]
MSEKNTAARLTRETVLRGALALLDDIGIDALSTRRLAQHLGVQSPTLYWHFKNKAELLKAMAETIMLDHREEVPADIPWQAWVTANAINFRRALLAYRDGARLHAGTRPQEPQFAIIEAKVALLCRAGFTPEHAVNLLFAVGRFVVGWVLEEQQMEPDDALSEADRRRYPLLCGGWEKLQEKGADTLFEAGIRLLVDGAEAALTNANNHGAQS